MPNRHKILTVASGLQMAGRMMPSWTWFMSWEIRIVKGDRDLYKFTYQRRWWTSRYRVYASHDEENLFVSVQGVIGSGHGRALWTLGKRRNCAIGY